MERFPGILLNWLPKRIEKIEDKMNENILSIPKNEGVISLEDAIKLGKVKENDNVMINIYDTFILGKFHYDGVFGFNVNNSFYRNADIRNYSYDTKYDFITWGG